MEIINTKCWIMEGVQSNDWTVESFSQSDYIVILNPNVYIRDYRIFKRFIKSRTGIEPWNYKQSMRNLIKMMVKWNHGYRLDELITQTDLYHNKRYIVKNINEIIKIIQEQKGTELLDVFSGQEQEI